MGSAIVFLVIEVGVVSGRGKKMDPFVLFFLPPFSSCELSQP